MEETKLLRAFLQELGRRKAYAGNGNESTDLRLRAPSGDELHVERSAAPPIVSVSYYVVKRVDSGGKRPAKELEVVLLVTATGAWVPIEFYRANRGHHHVYMRMDSETGAMTPVDVINQRACAAYCDAWSFYLREQGWLEKGIVV